MDSGALYRLHRPMNHQDGGLVEACPDCLGGILLPKEEQEEPRSCGCWGRLATVCGVCAVHDRSGHWHFQPWPCGTAKAMGIHWWTP